MTRLVFGPQAKWGPWIWILKLFALLKLQYLITINWLQINSSYWRYTQNTLIGNTVSKILKNVQFQLVFFVHRRETPEDNTPFYSRRVPHSRSARVPAINNQIRSPNEFSSAINRVPQYEIPRDNMGYEDLEMSGVTPTGHHYHQRIYDDNS